ncbi:hypothetical protein [Streptomyces sp. HUAS CX7]|uniref:AbiTii domain-containing protein n=1 Tax=Streptomyces sp. HUAS CX7 TaxID=3062782 RepID=UPI0026ECFA23|nr:hypothetical protein [Streptomyces sp. HUAS CX7]WKX19705.1 hypothetical protein Q3Y68_17300 [Streptomyces sp. HUAS CX7]
MRQHEALSLSEELLGDIELSRLPPQDIVRKASRLARFMDDFEAIEWLRYEVSGFPSPLDISATEAAKKSNRQTVHEGTVKYWTATLGSIQATVDAARARMSVSTENAWERTSAAKAMADSQGILDRILGSVYEWVSSVNYELRFGAAVESAFSVVRSEVDGRVSTLVPEAVIKLTSAFENAASDNPENWAGAASTCRRLIKSVADHLRPPGDPVGKRAMGDSNYINRLVDWIVNRSHVGQTQKDVIVADLEYLGRRLDAFADAGNKGAHAEVTRYEASRYITGTYLLLGDILGLHADDQGT